MKNPSLSIVIPTYNFGSFIGGTLDSILSQVTDEVEILVVDGASTDDTEAIVGTYVTRHPGVVRYHRLPKKGGIDRDMATSVELARGEYCWLFSADDIMAPGALATILRSVADAPDAVLCGFRLCTFDMRPKHLHPILSRKEAWRVDLNDAGERLTWFRDAITTTALFSFMSSVTIRRESWIRGVCDESFYGSCWAHVARIFGLILAGPFIVRYIPEPCLLKRDDNDSFSGAGTARRVGISIEGYQRISDAFFGRQSEEAFHVRRVLRNEYGFLNLLHFKRQIWKSGKPDDRALMRRLVSMLYDDPGPGMMLRRLAWNAAPAPLLGFAERAYRLLRRNDPALRR